MDGLQRGGVVKGKNLRTPLRGGRGFPYAASPARGFPYDRIREFLVDS
jgi:hypothetical protein